MVFEMSRICPDCQSPLQAKGYEGVTIDVCAACAGIFFDEGEVAQVMAKGLSAMEELDAEIAPAGSIELSTSIEPTKGVARKCPNCSTGMDKFRYMYSSDVVLDECKKCGGIWVEDGELRRMREVVAAHRKPPSRPEARRVAVMSAAGAAAPEERGFSLRIRRVQDFLRGVGR